MSRSSFADRSRPEKTIMANSRPRLFTRQEIIESFYTPGSDDEGNSDGEMLEDDREDETDVREDVPAPGFDLQIEREAAQSESSEPRSRSSSDVGMSSQDSDSDSSSDSSMEAESEGETEAVDPYEADIEEDEPANDQQQDADLLDEDDAEWVRNTNNFPRIPRFTGQPGIKVPLT
ncbi:hypothetical protein RRG08_037474 [Elysia crispata]|uniref:Uncharacterized protein n=1 Tax=Elysia crispata TaxID=231223 RepID=A0AAE1E705_9GAST|nr:hypothetical protein RRG08_037474 [Elysia crispata]